LAGPAPLSAKQGSHPVFETASVFVRFDHIARLIVNANYRMMCAAVMLGITDALTCAIQRVSAQLGLSKPAPQTVLNDQ